MKNLAGDPHATTECRAELDAAGVPVEVLDRPYGEPQSRVGGKLGDFTFRRAWYYWIVCGPMPLQQAEAMTTPLVCEMIRRWALVEQKAVA